MWKFNFFKPNSKVQKQRDVIRNTDLSIARFTRKGVLVSFLVLCISIFISDFFDTHRKISIVLILGLFVMTALRAYFLFRFDATYNQAPARWRNIYFAVTIVGSLWWGSILSFMTYAQGVTAEVSLLWLYTVAFFSCSTRIFAPYHRFHSIYMAASLLPPALISPLHFQPLDVLSGVILLIVFIFLKRHCKELNIDYWEKLQGTYDLKQQANALKAEKINTESFISSKEALFSTTAIELKNMLTEIDGSLSLLKEEELSDKSLQLVKLSEQSTQNQIAILQNVLDYSEILNKSLHLDSEVFDLRNALEKCIFKTSPYVHQQNIELLTQFSKEFPLRVKGDKRRIRQILGNLMISAVKFSNKGYMLIDIHHSQLSDDFGKLSVNLFIEKPTGDTNIEQELLSAFQGNHTSDISLGLHLSIAKGLAKSMHGTAGANYTEDDRLHFWFTIELPIVTLSRAPKKHIAKLSGKNLLLYKPPKIIEQDYLADLESWGLKVNIANELKDALVFFNNDDQADNPSIDVVMICTQIDDVSPIELSRTLLNHKMFHIPQVISITEEQKHMPAISTLLNDNQNIYPILKPISEKGLKDLLKQLFADKVYFNDKDKQDILKSKQILLLQGEKIESALLTAILEKLGCDVCCVHSRDDLLQTLEDNKFDAFFVDISFDKQSLKSFIIDVQEKNRRFFDNNYMMPVIGFNHHTSNEAVEEAKCLGLGMNAFLVSPFEKSDIEALLRRWISRAEYMANETQ